MNENNLIPGAHALTVEELSRGGKNSGASRRRKRDMKACMQILLSLPASEDDYKMLSDMGIEVENFPEDITNMLVVNAAILKAAKAGDIQAIRELRSIIRDDDYMKHKIKMDKERLKLAQKEFDNNNNWDI
ncbi:MAG: hypothetical protein NC253_14295 [Ruminococcus sp.]|nr:hypothetical protein [Ruminococcus sp.]MCM1381678.1 hypothetical protein [Muribaculaceae bacterium]MCM1480463.1 hypothetical protein [Muribaculaceae bacterium]